MSDLQAEPGRSADPRRRVLVCYEHRNAPTARAAQLVAAALARQGALTVVAALADVGPVELMSADLVIVGSWVEDVADGVARWPGSPRRTAGTRRRHWPSLRRGARAAGPVFCTYAISPRGEMADAAAALAGAGAEELPAGNGPGRAAGGADGTPWAGGPAAFGVGRLAAFCWPEVGRRELAAAAGAL